MTRLSSSDLSASDALEAAAVLSALGSMSRNEALAWLERATPQEAAAALEIGRMPRRSTLMQRLLDVQADRLAAEAAAAAKAAEAEAADETDAAADAPAQPH